MDTRSGKKKQQPAVPTAPAPAVSTFAGLPEALAARVVAFLPQWDAASARQLCKDMRAAVGKSMEELESPIDFERERDQQALVRLLSGLPMLQRLSIYRYHAAKSSLVSAIGDGTVASLGPPICPIFATVSCSAFLSTSRRVASPA